jgi:hypothetical protein
MKKRVLLFFLALSIGIGIAVTVKATKSAFSTCCDDSLRECSTINGVIIYGPKVTPPEACP